MDGVRVRQGEEGRRGRVMERSEGQDVGGVREGGGGGGGVTDIIGQRRARQAMC